ncbi:MAG TPA: hypothetical protein VJX94_04235 [Stellaceae bacterium]|nr:hypothetical protein [Stellaceae bacterium]
MPSWSRMRTRAIRLAPAPSVWRPRHRRGANRAADGGCRQCHQRRDQRAQARTSDVAPRLRAAIDGEVYPDAYLVPIASEIYLIPKIGGG